MPRGLVKHTFGCSESVSRDIKGGKTNPEYEWHHPVPGGQIKRGRKGSSTRTGIFLSLHLSLSLSLSLSIYLATSWLP
jgi:hypothetical protein